MVILGFVEFMSNTFSCANRHANEGHEILSGAAQTLSSIETLVLRVVLKQERFAEQTVHYHAVIRRF